MKGINEPSEFTEEQAIYITIENGYNGAEFETSVWKQRGCLKDNGTLKALINKLQTIYNHVEVTGAGKKRKYILKDKKSHITERQFNYKGSIPTAEDDIMKEYIFNKLITYPNGFNKSYKGWANALGFTDTSTLSIDDMIKTLKELHFGFPVIYNPKEAVSVFIQNINTRNKDIIEKSFQRLEKEDRIKVTEIYTVKYTDGTYENIKQLDYENILAYIKEFIESNGISYYAYSQALTSIYKSEKMKHLLTKVNVYLEDYYGIDYFFKSFRVSILNKNIHKEVTYPEFEKAYFVRFIQLSHNRQEKDGYKNSIYFRKRFYLLNTLALLTHMKITGVDKQLTEQKKLYIDKLDQFHIDLMINNLDTDIDNENKRHSFRNN